MHNSAAFVGEALGSVRAQSFQDFEVIVVDDGSTDRTWEAIQGATKVFHQRFQAIRGTPGQAEGPAYARNAGIKQARGEFIAFLDSDDQWVPEHLARAYHCFQAYGERFGFFAGPGQIMGTTRFLHEFPWPSPEPQSASPQLLRECYFPLASVCVRRSLLEQVGGFCEELVCHEDWLLYLLLSKLTLFVHSPNVECLVRRRAESVSASASRMSKAMYRDRVKAYLIAEASGQWSRSELRSMREPFIQGRASELADYLCSFDADRTWWATSGLLQSGWRGRSIWMPILWRGFSQFTRRGWRKATRASKPEPTASA